MLTFEAGPAELTLDWVAVLRDGQAVGSFSVLEVEAKSDATDDLAAARRAPRGDGLRDARATVEGGDRAGARRRDRGEGARPPAARAALAGDRRRGPARGGGPQGPADAPRADARERGRHPQRRGHRGPPPDARRDPTDARGLACLRGRLPPADRCAATSASCASVARALGEVRDLDVLLEGLGDVRRWAARGRRRGDGAAAERVAAGARTRAPAAHCAARLARLPRRSSRTTSS